MDCEKLINCVQNRRPLWDKHSKAYNNRDIIKSLWSEVAAELGVNPDDAKKKWSNLRDQFRKEFNKSTHSGKSGDGADSIFHPKWVYYSSMLFLSKQIAPKQCHGNLPAVDKETSSRDVIIPSTESPLPSQHLLETPQDTPDTHSVLQSPQPTPVSHYRQYASKASRKKRNDMDEEYLEIEKKKLKLFESRSGDVSHTDPDKNFLISLMPYMKAVPLSKKIVVQQKLLQVFLEEENAAPSIHLQSRDELEYSQSPVSVYSSHEGSHEQHLYVMNTQPLTGTFDQPPQAGPNILYDVSYNDVAAYSIIDENPLEDL